MKLFFTRPRVIFSLSSLFIILSLILSAPSKSAAQMNGHKIIHLSASTIKIVRIIEEAQSQTDYTFSYIKQYADLSKTVTLDKTDYTIDELIPELIAQTGLSFWQKGNVIIVREKQKGTVKGIVYTSDSKPAEGVSVQLQGSGIGAVTRVDGSYELKAPEGKYLLTVLFTGLQTQMQNIAIKTGTTLNVDFTLAENNEQLQDVLISVNTNVRTNPSSTLRLNTSLIETAQNIIVTGQQAIKDIGGLSIADILRTSSGTFVGYGSGQDIYITMRGNDVSGNRLRDGIGAGYYANSSEDVGMIDRVEFIKGPASFMVSNTDPSGLVNVVTKQPTNQRIADVNLGYGSYNMMRATIDFGGNLTKDSALTYRLNAGIQNQDAYYKFGYFKKYYLAGALKYRVDANTDVTFEYNRTYNHQLVDGNDLPTINGKFYTFERDYTITDPDGTGDISYDNFYRINAIHKFNSHWSLNAQGAVMQGNQYGYFVMENYMSPDYDTLYRQVQHHIPHDIYYSSQVFVSGGFNTGKGIKHKFLLGIDYGNYSRTYQGSTYNGTGNALALYLPNPTYYISKDTIENSTLGAPSTTGNRYTAFFVQDAVTFWGKVILSAGGRLTHNIEDLNSAPYQIKNNKFTPRLGLTYLFTPDISAYAMFDQSFVPQTGMDYAGNAFKPMYGSDREIGFKSYFFNKALSINADLYEIVENNNLTSDLQHPGFSMQTGQIKNKGVEFDLNGNITKQLRIMANYAYTDAKITKDNTASNIGMPNWGSIPNTANFFLKYTFTDKILKGLSIGAGAQYMDKAYWNADLVHTLPSYTLFEASLGYSVRQFYVNLNAYNLANKRYATYGYMYNDKDWFYQSGEPANFRIDFGIHL